ncbi:hypothetical protein EOM39_01150 [Candidatus Gracilibacteria bacterium]|nr:hypothetical protein [Candidatus Gracilibacteria bacterium]
MQIQKNILKNLCIEHFEKENVLEFKTDIRVAIIKDNDVFHIEVETEKHRNDLLEYNLTIQDVRKKLIEYLEKLEEIND